MRFENKRLSIENHISATDSYEGIRETRSKAEAKEQR